MPPSRRSAKRSGELGYLVESQTPQAARDLLFGLPLADALGQPSLKVSADMLLGPLMIDGQSALLLVEATYAGNLDEASLANLPQVNNPTADLSALAAKFSPNTRNLWDQPGWFAATSLTGNAPLSSALFNAPLSSLQGPFVYQDQLVFLQPLARQTRALDAIQTAAASVAGFADWLDGIRASASIILSPDPLPGATAAPGTSPLPQDSDNGLPSGLPTAPAPGLTPPVPVIPTPPVPVIPSPPGVPGIGVP